jgi:hypothetical protein
LLTFNIDNNFDDEGLHLAFRSRRPDNKVVLLFLFFFETKDSRLFFLVLQFRKIFTLQMPQERGCELMTQFLWLEEIQNK